MAHRFEQLPSSEHPETETPATEGLGFRSAHDISWDQLGPEHAAAVRSALMEAGRLRDSGRQDSAAELLQVFAIDQLISAA